MQKFKSHKLPYEIFFQLIFLKLPYLIGEVSAFLAFFATIHFFYNLSSSNQLIVLLTSGIKLRTIVLITCFVSLLIGFCTLIFIDRIGAVGIKKYEQIEADVKQQYPGSYYKLPMFLKEKIEDTTRIIKIGNIDLENKILLDVFISIFDENWNQQSSISAKSAMFYEDEMHLFDKISHKNYIKPKQKILKTTLNYEIILGQLTSPQKIKLWTLKKLLDKFEISGLSQGEHNLNYLRRFAKPFIMVIMTMLATGFIIIYQRSSLPKRIIIAACIIIAMASSYIEILTRMLVYGPWSSNFFAMLAPGFSVLIIAILFYCYRFKKNA